MNKMNLSTEVEVVRTGSEKAVGASGKTTIAWNFEVFTAGPVFESNEIVFKLNVPEQSIYLDLEYWDDAQEAYVKTGYNAHVKTFKLEGDCGVETTKDIIKMLKLGLKPKKLEIWRDEYTLIF